ncbi:MAG: hypothetical protein WC518_04440 [Patescibacteria group bacterium]
MRIKKIYILPAILFLAIILPNLAKAFSVSPPIIETDLNPGQSGLENLVLFNETEQEVFLNGYVETFRPRGEAGEVEVVPPAVSQQAVAWLKLPENSLSLKPGEEKTVPLIINVSKTAQVGGYYLAVMWETSLGPKKQTNQVQVSGRLGVLIFLRVEGAAKEEISLKDFRLAEKKQVFDRLPVGFVSRLENTGNVHLKPKGLIIIKSIFGVDEVLPFNEEEKNIMPQSIRSFNNDWVKAGDRAKAGGFWSELKAELGQFACGRFSAQLQAEYGPDHQKINSEKIYFWVLPWRLLLLAAIGLIIFLVATLTLRKISKNKSA